MGERQGPWLGLGEPYVEKEAIAVHRDSSDGDGEGGRPRSELCLPVW